MPGRLAGLFCTQHQEHKTALFSRFTTRQGYYTGAAPGAPGNHLQASHKRYYMPPVYVLHTQIFFHILGGGGLTNEIPAKNGSEKYDLLDSLF